MVFAQRFRSEYSCRADNGGEEKNNNNLAHVDDLSGERTQKERKTGWLHTSFDRPYAEVRRKAERAFGESEMGTNWLSRPARRDERTQ
ncbi:hypothetical protein M0D68_26290 [Paraburkholderia sp. SEWSISQ10-3 4]|nr:hypothetical protein [Paraburkholderia aspalathi]MDN7174409.1 hypothetical protein [Paraburkholderia sp. SEWSISQ10-3 4]MDQ6504050.1 hypothetical protein [Paraburkholderia aspalathi]